MTHMRGSPISLTDLDLDLQYRSDTHNTLNDFYIPCFEVSTDYRRSVGYFSSSALQLASRGLERFIANGGQMTLVASPLLSEVDVEAIRKGYRLREQVVEETVAAEIPESLPEAQVAFRHAWECLAWMVSTGSLEILLAVPKEAELTGGIYHEKVGIFTDTEGNRVAFTGSVNETAGGLVRNFESMDVYRSWIEAELPRVDLKEQDIDRLVSNRTHGLQVLPFPEACRRRLLRLRPKSVPVAYLPKEGLGLACDSSTRIVARPYQRVAIRSWFASNGRGTLRMATGTGKTIVALEIAKELGARVDLGAVIVVCPYKHLVDQWALQCAQYGTVPILAYEDRARWLEKLNGAVYAALTSSQRPVWILTTNATFSGEPFQDKLSQLPLPILLIADEAHNLGAVGLRAKLPKAARFRLALSATPERWFDDDGTEAILGYFGGILEPELTLRDAIAAGALVPYEYYPEIVELDDEESEDYLRVSALIARAADTEDVESSERCQHLLLRRARLVASAKGKIPALVRIVRQMTEVDHLLIYCGDGTVEHPVSGSSMRQVNRICQVLGVEESLRVATFTAERGIAERQDLMERLDTGTLQALVAIRCLDEGVDIPSVKTAIILASTSNPRQFIQRRGRILRPYPGKQGARIHDLIVAPPIGAEQFECERSLVRRELRRFREFAGPSRNSGTANLAVLELQKRFGLLDV